MASGGVPLLVGLLQPGFGLKANVAAMGVLANLAPSEVAAAGAIPWLTELMGRGLKEVQDAAQRVVSMSLALSAAYQLCLLAQEGPSAKDAIIGAGAAPLLVCCATQLQETGCGARLLLLRFCAPAGSRAILEAVARHGGVSVLGELATGEPSRDQRLAFCLLAQLLAGRQRDLAVAVLVEGPLPAGAYLKRRGKLSPPELARAFSNVASALVEGQVPGSVTLEHFCSITGLQRTPGWAVTAAAHALPLFVAQPGAAGWVVAMVSALPAVLAAGLGCEDARVQRHAAGALRNLAIGSPSRCARIVAAGGVETLVALLRRGAEDPALAAAGALRPLAVQSEEVRAQMVELGAVKALVRLARCPCRAAPAKAFSVLRVLASSSALHPSILDVVPREMLAAAGLSYRRQLLPSWATSVALGLCDHRGQLIVY